MGTSISLHSNKWGLVVQMRTSSLVNRVNMLQNAYISMKHKKKCSDRGVPLVVRSRAFCFVCINFVHLDHFPNLQFYTHDGLAHAQSCCDVIVWYNVVAGRHFEVWNWEKKYILTNKRVKFMKFLNYNYGNMMVNLFITIMQIISCRRWFFLCKIVCT